jgi:hypothetical protein
MSDVYEDWDDDVEIEEEGLTVVSEHVIDERGGPDDLIEDWDDEELEEEEDLVDLAEVEAEELND